MHCSEAKRTSHHPRLLSNKLELKSFHHLPIELNVDTSLKLCMPTVLLSCFSRVLLLLQTKYHGLIREVEHPTAGTVRMQGQ